MIIASPIIADGSFLDGVDGLNPYIISYPQKNVEKYIPTKIMVNVCSIFLGLTIYIYIYICVLFVNTNKTIVIQQFVTAWCFFTLSSP